MNKPCAMAFLLSLLCLCFCCWLLLFRRFLDRYLWADSKAGRFPYSEVRLGTSSTLKLLINIAVFTFGFKLILFHLHHQRRSVGSAYLHDWLFFFWVPVLSFVTEYILILSLSCIRVNSQHLWDNVTIKYAFTKQKR